MKLSATVRVPPPVSWMTIDKTAATLAPGEKVKVTVTMTANVDQPGTYSGAVSIKENTPYAVQPVTVTMTAQQPKTWGKLMGTVTGTSCAGAGAPIRTPSSRWTRGRSR